MTTEEYQIEVLRALNRIETALSAIRNAQTSMYPQIGPPHTGTGHFEIGPQGPYWAGDPAYLQQQGQQTVEHIANHPPFTTHDGTHGIAIQK
jgi:hypothetical protein